IAVLCVLTVCDTESGDYGEFEDEFQIDDPPDYSKINISDASWNITLMRYLNFKENDMERNLNSSVCHRLSNRFAPKSTPPFGFCEMENGSGSHNFLVLGNGYAINLGPLVYHAFKDYAKEFNIFSLRGCDTMMQHQRPLCKDNVNYTDMLNTLKPDVIFVLENHVLAKKERNETASMEHDEIFREQLEKLEGLEQVAKKVYILQALPSLNHEKYFLTYTVTPIRKIKDRLIKNDDTFARQRIEELGRRCLKCEILDIKPALVDNKGRYRGYNSKNNLLYIDQWNHFTRFDALFHLYCNCGVLCVGCSLPPASSAP
ncbi:hypothetical protein V3C99_000717, partial [Haemonchus contortus]